MPYKVFLVEDEITTREGIRDNVNWQSVGFELCGEAQDGEIALPQIETLQPDVIITDIKMPFMDGLQLCKIIREHMSWIKIIIISGYNDFQYAQTAIKLGVTEYLLKPVSVQDLQNVLSKVALTLDQEKQEREYLKKLRSQVEDNLHLMREKFLLRLVTGGESSISAIEQSQQLGLNILAPFYQVLLLEVKPQDALQPLHYEVYQQVERLILETIGTNLDILLTKKDIEEFVLILKGENLEQLEQESPFLVKLLQEEVKKSTKCRLVVGTGSPQQRLGDLYRSFVDALVKEKDLRAEVERGELKKLDHQALRRFLENGELAEFDTFYTQTLQTLAEAALRSNLLKRYVMIDIGLAASQFVSDLGGTPQQIIPAGYDDDGFLTTLQTPEQLRKEIKNLFVCVIDFRKSQAQNDHAALLLQAKKYIGANLSDANLSLNEVAAQVNFSPNHFSAVFSNECGETFRDYLTRCRLENAKKLLRTTPQKCSEIAFLCGYNDPHYFSLIFRKNYGVTPQQYRESEKKKGG
jgi:two-component system response regulator YesN